MANYYARARTSYVKVIDPEEFKDWADQLSGTRVVDKETGEHGRLCALIFEDGIPDTRYCEDYEEWVEIDFYAEFQDFLPEGWAVTLMEVGYEGARYVSGHAVVLTRDELEQISLSQEVDKALNALGNVQYTECQY